jgi:hypothetical protein
MQKTGTKNISIRQRIFDYRLLYATLPIDYYRLFFDIYRWVSQGSVEDKKKSCSIRKFPENKGQLVTVVVMYLQPLLPYSKLLNKPNGDLG